MKLIIAGATGFIAQELIQQSLSHPDIKSVVALARRPVAARPGASADGNKLKSVVVKDYDDYPEEVRKELAGADACRVRKMRTHGSQRREERPAHLENDWLRFNPNQAVYPEGLDLEITRRASASS
jgi:uncharacterized protein YbjT (DUF2867 family)